MKIILLRHGKPALENWPKLSAHGMGAWIEAYNNSGIIGTPSDATIQAADSCEVLVCSTLQRAIESAQLLRQPGKPLIKKPIFKEMELPFADRNTPRLSPRIWLVIFRLLWFLGYSRHCTSFQTEKKRAADAAEQLNALAEKHGSVMLVGHGMLNRFIAGKLLNTGWTGPKSSGTDFWQYGVFTKDQDTVVS